jgi:regulatory protein
MMEYRITGLQVQIRNPRRVNVELDGEYAFGLSRIVATWLQVGQTIDEAKIARLKEEDERETAFQYALRLLSYRSRTKKEIQNKLKEHGITDETTDLVIERLERATLVDDVRFAQDWINNRSEFRPRSKRALAYELQNHGVDRLAIEDLLIDVDDAELAYQAARKHARKIRSLEWLDFRQKMVGYLARRGFAYPDCITATKRVWDETVNEFDMKYDEVDE